MALDFRKLLTPQQQAKIAEADEHYARELIKFRNLTTKNLVSSARYYMTQMKEPWKHEFGTPVYDAVFYHVVIPELLRRLGYEEDSKKENQKASIPGVESP